MADALAEIDAVASEAETDLANVATPDALEQWRLKYLGSKGRMKGLMNLIGQAPPDQTKAVGQRANESNARVRAAFEAKQQGRASGAAHARDAVYVTEPGRRP